MTAVPDFVKIGAYTIPVIYTKNLLSDSGAWGQYNPRLKQIELDPDACDEQQFGTFCHEVIEAWKEIFAIMPLAENHEAIITLGECLHMYLRDNGVKVLPE